MKRKTAIVIGGGIVGLSHARALAKNGFKVTVFERNPVAVGASIRNFGMVWPIGQPDGGLYERASRSRNIWLEVCREANLWHNEVGSLHIATTPLEAEAMQAIASNYGNSRPLSWLGKTRAMEKSAYINEKNCLGALWSPDEIIVEARQAIPSIAKLLNEKYEVDFFYTTAINQVTGSTVHSGNRKWQADLIFICSGADFETLYPELYYSLDITKCKLQMMRLGAQQNALPFGPALCGGLSLIHYKGFEVTPLLSELRRYYEQEMPDYLKWGIHVMACENNMGDITIGDTHEYGWHLDPFDKSYLNNMVLAYLDNFTTLGKWQVMQTWNGIYAKMTNGQSEMVHKMDEQVYVVNGLGGAGMTLSFGLAEELVSKI